MIEVTGLSHSIGRAGILHGIELALPRGGLTALIGPNGAGKSTLLNLIARLEPVRSGRITIDGLDVTTTPSRIIARHLAFLGQSNFLGSRLRVGELVAFGRWPHHQGRPRASDHAAVAAALAAFELGPLAGRFMDELSGGQQQRAFLAMTFAQGTDWLLLDEPINNLDMVHARALMERLARLVREEGKSVVIVVHDINYAAAWADRIVAMRDGRIVAEGPPGELLTTGTLERIYGVGLAVAEHGGRPMVLHHA
jgi:iron complex transport system ATP-binding protein